MPSCVERGLDGGDREGKPSGPGRDDTDRVGFSYNPTFSLSIRQSLAGRKAKELGFSLW